jgi:hypothetical protein
MTDETKGPVNLTQLEKAQRLGRIGNGIGLTLVGTLTLGVIGLVIWGVFTLVVLVPGLGWGVVGFLALVGTVWWASEVTSEAEKLEKQAKRYGVVDE